MQAAFFKIWASAEDQALQMIGWRSKNLRHQRVEVVDMNIPPRTWPADHIDRIDTAGSDPTISDPPPVPAGAPGFVQDVTAEIIAGRGDWLPVSKMPVDGTFPTATPSTRSATSRPRSVWGPRRRAPVQQCAFVCPHATIRMKVYPAEFANGNSPLGRQTMEAQGRGWEGMKYTLRLRRKTAPAAACCVETCPAYAKDASGQKTERKAITHGGRDRPTCA